MTQRASDDGCGRRTVIECSSAAGIEVSPPSWTDGKYTLLRVGHAGKSTDYLFILVESSTLSWN